MIKSRSSVLFLVTVTILFTSCKSTDSSFGELYCPSPGAGIHIVNDEYAIIGNQHLTSRSKVAADAQGNYVVVWANIMEGDTDGQCPALTTCGQRYSADGIPLGDIFQIYEAENLSHASVQRPDIAMDDEGNFVVVFHHHFMPDLENSGRRAIKAQLYSSDGIPKGDRFEVSSDEANPPLSRSYPTVAMNSSGGFVIAWRQLHSSVLNPVDGIYVRHYDSAGNPLGEPFRADTDQQQEVHEASHVPSIAIGPDGRFVIAWRVTWADDNDTHQTTIRARQFDASATGSPEFDVATVFDLTDTSNSRVGMDDNGNFVVAWRQIREDGNNIFKDIYARRYNTIGEQLGEDIEVASVDIIVTPIGTLAGRPAVAMDASGNFAVTHSVGTYALNSPGNRTHYIMARVFSDGGDPVGESFVVNDCRDDNVSDRDSAIALNDNGQFVITWGRFLLYESENFQKFFARQFSMN